MGIVPVNGELYGVVCMYDTAGKDVLCTIRGGKEEGMKGKKRVILVSGSWQ